MSIHFQNVSGIPDSVGSSNNKDVNPPPVTPAQRQPSVTSAQPGLHRLRTNGGAGVGQIRAGAQTTGARAARSAPSGTAGAVPQSSNLDIKVQQLNEAESDILQIGNGIPTASDAVQHVLSRQFTGNAKYTALDERLGAGWPSQLTLGLKPARDVPSAADRFQVSYTNPYTGNVSYPPELNDGETKRALLGSFASTVKTEMKAAADAYWDDSNDGDWSRSQLLAAAEISALVGEAGIRVQSGTLSPDAYFIASGVWTNELLRPRQYATEVSRLRVDGKDVPGAFVFTDSSTGKSPSDKAVLWRPGRPLQEFDSLHDLRAWVGNEGLASEPGRRLAVDTAPASDRPEYLRVQDLRAEMDDALASAHPSHGVSDIGAYLDSVSSPSAYLDQSRAWDGAATQQYRKDITDPAAPGRFMELEAARQKAMVSGQRLQDVVDDIPTLGDYARSKLIERMAKDYPDSALVDPDRTIVKTSVKKVVVDGPHPSRMDLEIGMLPTSRIVTVSERDYTLTEYALRNAKEWVAPTIGSSLSTPSGSGEEVVSADLLDENGRSLVDKEGRAINLGTKDMESLVYGLDVGGRYTDMLKGVTRPGESAQLADSWVEAIKDRVKSERIAASLDPVTLDGFRWRSNDGSSVLRGLRYVDAVIDHPDPDERPEVDSHRIVANRLILGATTETGGGGQTINGVAVFGTDHPRSSPAVVLYTPDAPDNITFRELSDIGGVDDLIRDPGWKDYFISRMSTSDRDVANQALNPRGSTGRTVIKPMRGNFYDEMYKSESGYRISNAQHRSTSSAQVSGLSVMNQGMFAYDAIGEVAPFLPAKGAAGVARRASSALLNRFVKPKASVAMGPGFKSTRVGGDSPSDWVMRDLAVIDRLRPGNRGAGGVRYQRDPVTQKEYLNVDGNYYRGEVRRGQNVVFDDRNYSSNRVVKSTPEGLLISPRGPGLRGGVGEVPQDVLVVMDEVAVIKERSSAFKRAYYSSFVGWRENDEAINKVLRAAQARKLSVSQRRKHEAAMRAAESLDVPVVAPPGGRPQPGPNGGVAGRVGLQPVRPRRVQVTGEQLDELKRRDVFHYTTRKGYASMLNDRAITYSKVDPNGQRSSAYNYTIYFTDLPPDRVGGNAGNMKKLFGAAWKNQKEARWERNERVLQLDLDNLPENARIFKEGDHNYTVDFSRMGGASMALPFGGERQSSPVIAAFKRGPDPSNRYQVLDMAKVPGDRSVPKKRAWTPSR